MIHSSTDSIPKGFRIEWRVDDDFQVVSDGTCRHKGCTRPAVAALFRKVFYRTGRWSKRRWNCCSEHMYGREIRDGKVMIDCLKKIDGD